jgi:hypothetical protein
LIRPELLTRIHELELVAELVDPNTAVVLFALSGALEAGLESELASLCAAFVDDCREEKGD